MVTAANSKPGLRGDAYASIPNVIDAAMAGNKYAELVTVEDGTIDAAALGIEINKFLDRQQPTMEIRARTARQM